MKRSVGSDREVTFRVGEGVTINTADGRTWRYKQIIGGVRLAVRDVGDKGWTNAGVFPTAEAAEAEVRRVS
jgi:hypothetical protein